MKKSIQINLVRGFRKEHLFSWEIPTGLKMYVNALDPPVVATLQPGATRREVLTDFIWQHVFKCGSPDVDRRAIAFTFGMNDFGE